MKSKDQQSIKNNKKTIRFIHPMLATLVKKAFSSKEWIFETKFDGLRCIACKRGKIVTLYSRNKKNMNTTFPEIVEALEKLSKTDFVIDGEIVTFNKGVTSFEKLQPRMHVKKPSQQLIRDVKVYFYIFDLLIFHSKDLRKESLLNRKAVLKKHFSFSKILRHTVFRSTEGEKYFEEAKRKGLEGIIAKKKDSIYVSKRSKDWQKFKCENSQELIIIGYTDPKGSRCGFGALLLGYYKAKKLIFAGKVGTGFDRSFLKKLSSKLKRIEKKTSPIDEKINGKVHWVTPKIVAEVSFTEWTKDGKLRHPRFIGIRIDKSAEKVVRE